MRVASYHIIYFFEQSGDLEPLSWRSVYPFYQRMTARFILKKKYIYFYSLNALHRTIRYVYWRSGHKTVMSKNKLFRVKSIQNWPKYKVSNSLREKTKEVPPLTNPPVPPPHHPPGRHVYTYRHCWWQLGFLCYCFCVFTWYFVVIRWAFVTIMYLNIPRSCVIYNLVGKVILMVFPKLSIQGLPNLLCCWSAIFEFTMI